MPRVSATIDTFLQEATAAAAVQTALAADPEGARDALESTGYSLTAAPVNATPSRLQIGPFASGIEILSQVFGTSRNGTTVEFVQGVGISVAASAAYAADTITVTLPTDGAGAAVPLNYGDMSDIITDDLLGDWIAISTAGTTATVGVKGVTAGGTDATPATAAGAELFVDANTGNLLVPSSAQGVEGTGWKSFVSERRISGNLKVSMVEAGALDYQEIIDGFQLTEAETVNGATLKITGTVSFVQISNVDPAGFLTIGFSPQYQHPQERCGAICSGLASGVIHYATEILISTAGGSDSIYKWKLDASREPQGILIDPTPAFNVLDINGTGYWEDNMTTREAPVGFFQRLEFGVFYSGPVDAEYLIGYDLALTVELP